MKYNIIDPFNEEDWDEKDVPQENTINWGIDFDLDVVLEPYEPGTMDIYIRRQNGNYHFFTETNTHIYDIMDYVNNVPNVNNMTMVRR